jgi:pilus assembly protein CpaC
MRSDSESRDELRRPARGASWWMCLVPVIMSAAAAVGSAGVEQPEGVLNAVEQNGKVELQVGHSQVIRPPWQVVRVSVTDPEVADVEVLRPDQVLLMGRRPGRTDLILWSQQEEIWRARVEVGIDLPRLNDDLRDVFPGAQLRATQVQNAIVVSGHLRRADDMPQLESLMELTGLPWLNRTSLAGVHQVQLRVRVAEVSRTALRTLGINTYYSNSSVVGGIAVGSAGPIQPVTIGPGQIDSSFSPAVTIFGGLWDANLQMFIQALAENQYLRVLAEPTLHCLSGEDASFLAGGEFPIPIVQSAGVGGSAAITIEYRPFGVHLRFRPIVLGDNAIRLTVSPEVSDLSEVGAVVIQGLRVPAVRTSRAETTLELKSGQTFALAGLLNHRTDARSSRIPGFGDLPILGALFRSVRYQQGDTELLIVVTASLVSPDDFVGRPAMPGDLHTPPNDWELYATGRIAGRTAARLAPADAAWLRERGLDQLRGPGAWASYDAPRAPSMSTSRRPRSEPRPAATETPAADDQGDGGPAEQGQRPESPPVSVFPPQEWGFVPPAQEAPRASAAKGSRSR